MTTTSIITLPFVAEEEGLGGTYREADTPFQVTLNDDSSGTLSIDGTDTTLAQNWQSSGTKDGESGTETSLTGGDSATLVNVTVEQLDNGCARSSVHWPNAQPTREIIGFCDDWKSLT
ncbi:hypothetical protein A8B78_15205 [Jannaschia sp. EhC01]|nr:hypothetical protein A8B78_15205 [Jannaschia sp. EhC01]